MLPKPRPFLETKIRRLPEAKAVTIALGIIGADSLIVGSDTQETYGDQKYAEGKIISGFRSAPNPDGAICISGAGAADHIDAASQEILEKFQDFSGTMDEFESWLRKFVAKFYSRHVLPFIGKTEDIPGFRLLIGCRHDRHSRLWTTARTVLTQKIPYAVVGLSMGSSNSLLSQLYPSMPSLNVTAMLATYVIRQAKLSSDGIGLETEIRFIYKEKASIIPQRVIKGWEEVFSRYQNIQHDIFSFLTSHDPLVPRIPGIVIPRTKELSQVMADLEKMRGELYDLPIVTGLRDFRPSTSEKSESGQ